MSISIEWVKNRLHKKIYAVSNSKAVVRGEGTLEDSLVSIESLLEEDGISIEDVKESLDSKLPLVLYPESDDCNELYNSGIYKLNTDTTINSPFNLNGILLSIYFIAQDNVFQIFFPKTDTTEDNKTLYWDDDTSISYIRQAHNNGTEFIWHEWVERPSLSKLGGNTLPLYTKTSPIPLELSCGSGTTSGLILSTDKYKKAKLVLNFKANPNSSLDSAGNSTAIRLYKGSGQNTDNLIEELSFNTKDYPNGIYTYEHEFDFLSSEYKDFTAITIYLSGYQVLMTGSMYILEGDSIKDAIMKSDTSIEELTERANETDSTIEELKKSVSDGKSGIASAITNKGVATESDATFDVMKNNIESIITDEPLGTTSITPSDLLSNVTAYNGNKQLIIGTMTAHASTTITRELHAGESYTIPTGYHNGEGIITAHKDAEASLGKTVAGINGNSYNIEVSTSAVEVIPDKLRVFARQVDGSVSTGLTANAIIDYIDGSGAIVFDDWKILINNAEDKAGKISVTVTSEDVATPNTHNNIAVDLFAVKVS